MSTFLFLFFIVGKSPFVIPRGNPHRRDIRCPIDKFSISARVMKFPALADRVQLEA